MTTLKRRPSRKSKTSLKVTALSLAAAGMLGFAGLAGTSAPAAAKVNVHVSIGVPVVGVGIYTPVAPVYTPVYVPSCYWTRKRVRVKVWSARHGHWHTRRVWRKVRVCR